MNEKQEKQPQLPPCPFCGVEPIVIAETETLPPQPLNVMCRVSGCAIFNKIISVEAWSRRAAASPAGQAANLEDIETVALEEIATDDNEDSHVRIARRVLQTARPTRTQIFNFLSRCAQLSDCGCTHEDENCCAKAGEPCTKCEAAALLAPHLPQSPQWQPWMKDIPRNGDFYVAGYYWQRRLSNFATSIIEVNYHGYIWHGGSATTEYVHERRATGDYEWSGPIAPPSPAQPVTEDAPCPDKVCGDAFTHAMPVAHVHNKILANATVAQPEARGDAPPRDPFNAIADNLEYAGFQNVTADGPRVTFYFHDQQYEVRAASTPAEAQPRCFYCQEPTDLACSDCRITLGAVVSVCAKTSCRDEHERNCPKSLAGKADAEMERVKACEHIAEGDEGWEALRNLCPSTMAVATLRDQFVARAGVSREAVWDEAIRIVKVHEYHNNKCMKDIVSQLERAARDAQTKEKHG